MTRPQRPCLDCGALTRNPRGRCRPCQQKADRIRNHDPRRTPRTNDWTYRKLRERIRAGGFGPCVQCGTWDDLTADHIIPLSAGGTNDPTNLQVLCRTHNLMKHNTTHETRGA